MPRRSGSFTSLAYEVPNAANGVEVIWWPFGGRDKEEGGVVIVLILVLVKSSLFLCLVFLLHFWKFGTILSNFTFKKMLTSRAAHHNHHKITRY